MVTNDRVDSPQRVDPARRAPTADADATLALHVPSAVLTEMLEELACGLFVVEGEHHHVLAQNGRAIAWFGPAGGASAWELLGTSEAVPPCAVCAAPAPDPGPTGLGAPHVHELFSARLERWYRCTVRPLRLADGSLGRLLALEDVTDRRLAEIALRRQRDLLDPFIRAQSHQLAAAPIEELLAGVLDDVLALTDSACGFVGEIYEGADGSRSFQMHAVRRIDPDGHTPIACAGSRPDAPVRCEPGTPFGSVALAGEPLLINDAPGDPRVAGMPEGHPPLRSFLGLPLYGRGSLVGVVGLANRPGGYDEDQVALLEPLCAGIGGIIVAYRAGRQRAEAERELRESNLLLNEVLGTLRDPLYVIDPVSWRVLFAVPTDALGGREPPVHCHALLHGAAAPCPSEHCPVAQVVATGREAAGDHIHRNAEGLEQPVRVEAYPLLDSQGRVRRVLVRSRADRAQPVSSKGPGGLPAWDLLGRFAGGLVREIGDVVSAVEGRAELALRELPFDEPARRHLEAVRETAARGSTFTRHLRAIGRRTRLDLGLVSLTESTARLEPLLRPLLGGDIAVTTSLAPDVPFVRADVAQMERLLLLLAAAARETMPNGGKLVLRTGAGSWHEPTAEAPAPPVPAALLEMSDTGAGLAPDALADLRAVSAEADPSLSPLCRTVAEIRAIVERHRGWLEIDSRLGLGTVFRIYLPVAVTVGDESPFRPHSATPQAPNLESRTTDTTSSEPSLWQRWFQTVLVADDDAALRQLLADILEPLGHRVLLAATAATGLQSAGELRRPLDLAIIDLALPDLGGAELARRLASARAETQFLLLSGPLDAPPFAADELVDRTVVLSKPFSPEALLDAMKRLAEHQQARTEARSP